MDVLAALLPPLVAAVAFVVVGITVYRYAQRADAAQAQEERDERRQQGPESAKHHNGEAPS